MSSLSASRCYVQNAICRNPVCEFNNMNTSIEISIVFNFWWAEVRHIILVHNIYSLTCTPLNNIWLLYSWFWIANACALKMTVDSLVARHYGNCSLAVTYDIVSRIFSAREHVTAVLFIYTSGEFTFTRFTVWSETLVFYVFTWNRYWLFKCKYSPCYKI